MEKEDEEGKPLNIHCTMHRKKQRHRVTPPMPSRNPLKIYACENCPAVFSRVTQLKYHAQAHLNNQNEVSF